MRWIPGIALLALMLMAPFTAPAHRGPWESSRLLAPLGTDEFGRDLLLVVVISAGRSLALGFGLAVATLAAAAGFAFVLAGRISLFSRTAVTGSQIIESIPVLFWVLVAYAALRGASMAVASLTFIIAVLPFTSAVLSGEIVRLSEEPFIAAARLAGATRLRLLFGHFLPNASAITAPLFIQLIGLGAAVPGAIGVLGFSNRSSYDIGIVLLRGRESVADHPVLLITSLSVFVLIYAGLDATRRAVAAAFKLSSTSISATP